MAVDGYDWAAWGSCSAGHDSLDGRAVVHHLEANLSAFAYHCDESLYILVHKGAFACTWFDDGVVETRVVERLLRCRRWVVR